MLGYQNCRCHRGNAIMIASYHTLLSFFLQNFPRQGGIGQKQFISLEGKPQNTFLGVAGGTRTCGLSGHRQIFYLLTTLPHPC